MRMEFFIKNLGMATERVLTRLILVLKNEHSTQVSQEVIESDLTLICTGSFLILLFSFFRITINFRVYTHFMGLMINNSSTVSR